MLKLANVLDEETKVCAVASGDDIEFYRSIGMTEMDVEFGYDNQWYVKGYAPVKPEPTKEEVRQTRKALYRDQKDPITCQIQSLRDEEQTEDIIAEIDALKVKRAEIVAKIKEENPYPEEKEEIIEKFVEETKTTGTIL